MLTPEEVVTLLQRLFARGRHALRHFAATALISRTNKVQAVSVAGRGEVFDPGYDLTIAWTLFSSGTRETFRAALPLDGAAWARGRGWALWKSLITLAEHIDTNPTRAREARRIIDEVFADRKNAT